MKLSRLATMLAIPLFVSSLTHAGLQEKYNTDGPLAVDVQKRIFSKIFDVELWSGSYPTSYDQDITIRIKLATAVDVSDITEFMADEARDIHGFSKAQMNDFAKSVGKSINCVPTPDTIMDFNYVPGSGVIVTCDEVVSNVIVADGLYTTYLLDIFLHEKSEYSKLAR